VTSEEERHINAAAFGIMKQMGWYFSGDKTVLLRDSENPRSREFWAMGKAAYNALRKSGAIKHTRTKKQETEK
jgi:hypothetical protein